MKKHAIIVLSFCLFLTTISADDVSINDISNFNVTAKEDKIILSWSCKPGNNILIYRAQNPFKDFSSLIGAVLLGNFADYNNSFVDYPVEGNYYYYAVLSKQEVTSGKVKFIAGKNTSKQAHMILPKQPEVNTKTRKTPLPFLNPKQSQKADVMFSDKTENIIGKIKKEAYNYEDFLSIKYEREPFIFEEDKAIQSTQTTAPLNKILNSFFITKQWYSLEIAISNFLQIRRTEKITAKANFYLGQSYFFQEKYEKALESFFESESIFPEESDKWIRYSLIELSKKRHSKTSS